MQRSTWGGSGMYTGAGPTYTYEPSIGSTANVGRPKDLEFNSLIDPETGLLKSQYQMTTTSLTPELNERLSGIQADTRGLDKFREFALGTGDSEFAQRLLEKQKLDQQSALEDATSNAASKAAQARTAMAMRGGLSSGAAERLSRNSMLDAYKQKQQIQRQGMSDRLGIQAQDAQARQSALAQLPGMEINALNPELQKTSIWSNVASGDRSADLGVQEFNLGGAMGDVQNQRNFDLDMWKKRMEEWAGNKQAELMSQ